MIDQKQIAGSSCGTCWAVHGENVSLNSDYGCTCCSRNHQGVKGSSMKRFAIAIVLLLCAVISHAQTNNVNPWYPHPYVEGGLALSGGGYSPFSWSLYPGLNWETSKLSFNGSVSYSFSKKTNDGTADNFKGHSRGFGGDLFYKLPNNWLVGGGGGWGETATTNYSKQASSWSAGGGYDFQRPTFPARITVQYLRQVNEFTRYPTPHLFTAPGEKSSYMSDTCKCLSGVSGFTAGFWLPSPRMHNHLYFHEQLTTIYFHDTVTDPYSSALTNIQIHKHHISSFLTLSIGYRF